MHGERGHGFQGARSLKPFILNGLKMAGTSMYQGKRVQTPIHEALYLAPRPKKKAGDPAFLFKINNLCR